MLKIQRQEKNYYISKINKANNKQNKINNLPTKKIINAKIINTDRIFTKNNNPKKSDGNLIINQRIHKKIFSNVEDYNKLAKLNIENKFKKISLNNITNKIKTHRRILTEKKISDINNMKKRNQNRFILINTRNIKNDDKYRLITEYFLKENKDKTKDLNSQHISQQISQHNTQKSISNINSDFNQLTSRTTRNSIIKNLKKREYKKNSENVLINEETPNKKRYMKYLKANNLYNHSLDNTYSNLKLNQKEISNLNSINNFINLQEITNIFPNNISNFNTSIYGYSLDLKKQILIRNQNKIKKKKLLKKEFFNDLLKTYNNILTERPPFKKTINLNLKKYFPQKMNNLTIDILLKDTKRKGLPKINIKKIILNNRNSHEINSNSKEKKCLTSQNSLKNIKSPKNNMKINEIKNKFEIKKKNLWNIKINLDKNSKIKIAKYMKQNNLSKINHKKISSEIIKIKNIFSLTKKGFWQPETEKPNQDNFFIFKNITSESNNYFIGVCDGHGKYGKEISSFISVNLPLNLKQNFLDNKIKLNKESLSTISKIITKTFIQTNLSLNLNSNIGTSSSGSTCSSIILTPYRLISINLGDSRCVLGKYNNKWSYVNLTRDHKPKEEDEKKRILEKGGKISKEKDEFGNKTGIARIWKKDGGNIGLALTRSFGDEILSKIGVICEPEVKEFILGKDDKFIIIGTDGLWEYITSQECVEIVKEFYLKNDIQGAINYLFKESAKRWITEQDVIDDITIILIFLE